MVTASSYSLMCDVFGCQEHLTTMTRLSIGPVKWSYTLCLARILMDRLPRAQSKPVIRMPSSSARNGATEASPLVAKARSLDVPTTTASDGKRKTRPPILPTAKSMPMPIALTPRTQYAKQVRLMATVMSKPMLYIDSSLNESVFPTDPRGRLC